MKLLTGHSPEWNVYNVSDFRTRMLSGGNFTDMSPITTLFKAFESFLFQNKKILIDHKATNVYTIVNLAVKKLKFHQTRPLKTLKWSQEDA